MRQNSLFGERDYGGRYPAGTQVYLRYPRRLLGECSQWHGCVGVVVVPPGRYGIRNHAVMCNNGHTVVVPTRHKGRL